MGDGSNKRDIANEDLNSLMVKQEGYCNGGMLHYKDPNSLILTELDYLNTLHICMANWLSVWSQITWMAKLFLANVLPCKRILPPDGRRLAGGGRDSRRRRRKEEEEGACKTRAFGRWVWQRPGVWEKHIPFRDVSTQGAERPFFEPPSANFSGAWASGRGQNHVDWFRLNSIF